MPLSNSFTVWCFTFVSVAKRRCLSMNMFSCSRKDYMYVFYFIVLAPLSYSLTIFVGLFLDYILLHQSAGLFPQYSTILMTVDRQYISEPDGVHPSPCSFPPLLWWLFCPWFAHTEAIESFCIYEGCYWAFSCNYSDWIKQEEVVS